MIGQLRGKLIQKQPPVLLIDVQGVGYEEEAPMTTFYNLPDINNDILLYSQLAIWDDAHLLFGFSSEQERHMFRTLIKVNGVGAKMALAILSGMEAWEFAQCINGGDSVRLTRLPGVGKKTAERLIVEMRDRLKGISFLDSGGENATQRPVKANNIIDEAVSALISLGYKPQDASRYVHAVAAEQSSSEEIIREALKALVK